MRLCIKVAQGSLLAKRQAVSRSCSTAANSFDLQEFFINLSLKYHDIQHSEE
jgi:hypothetical protein